MIPDYNAKDLVNLRFRAKENAELQNTDCTITAIADYVYKTSAGEKLVKQVTGSTNFTTSGLPGDTDNDGKITLIDLSNIIDMFGVKSGEALWAEARFFDFNKNNEIDIADIVAIAKKIS
jgi:sialidase-1